MGMAQDQRHGTRVLGVLAIGFLSLVTMVERAVAQSDACAGATIIAAGIVSGTTTGATNDGAAACGQSATSPDVWYRFVAPAACQVNLAMCGSSYDTVLSVHDGSGPSGGCPGTVANQLACNDDSCALSSRVQLNASAGQPLLIRVSGYNGASGVFSLELSCLGIPSDDCAGATIVHDGDSFSSSTLGMTTDGESTCGVTATSPDVWYRFTPAADCRLAVTTCGSQYDTVLALYDGSGPSGGCPATTANQIACNDDFCGLSSRVDATARAGLSYLIRVTGWQDASGTFTLNVSCSPIAHPGNDDCTQATDVGAGIVTGDTSGATNDGAATCGSSALSPDVWYRYTADHECILHADSCGSAYDTVLSIHRDCPGTTQNQLACNDDSCTLSSRVVARLIAGQSVYLRVSGFNGAAGAFNLNVSCDDPPPPGVGADVLVGELGSMGQYGREGNVVGCAIDTPVCNAGSDPLDWMGVPDNRHPFMVFNMYRLTTLADGATRFEQVGQSWVKHGLGAAQGDACGLGCLPNPDATHLGVGCSDTYSADYNSIQNNMGPRAEINPWTGAFTYAGSHMATPQPPHTPISHRLQLHDTDIDPATHASSTFLGEVYIVAHDDTNHMNSIAHEQVSVSGTPGGTWGFGLGTAQTVNGPAINSWQGATRTTIPATLTDDGRCILAVRTTLRAGSPSTWHYEYALYNHDMDRGVRSVTIPIGTARVSNVQFHSVESHDEPAFDNSPWSVAIAGGSITWSTSPAAPFPATSNPIRWGTMYTFSFDADRSPVDSTATLGLFKPGTPGSLTGGTRSPGVVCRADWNQDHVVDSQDFFAFLDSFFASNADYNGDGQTTSQDFFDFLGAFFAGCP